MRSIITISLICIFIAGCSSTKNTFIGAEYILNDEWVLQNLGGHMADTSTYNRGLPFIELKVDATVFTGNTGCNSMSGSVQSTKTTIKFFNIVQTEMFCEGIDEKKFINALLNSDSWTYENERLFLYHGKVVTAVFRKK